MVEGKLILFSRVDPEVDLCLMNCPHAWTLIILLNVNNIGEETL